ncbi:MAG: radical SAM family heme chaperone HemW [Gammaproteobacteria bacterium]|nr:radical SAM family heme chaperone HemW [Gammaproteobacteria bacterium]
MNPLIASNSRHPLPQLPPLALYVHIPWCIRKCPYCDFNSHAAPAALPEADYVDALLRDLEQDLPLAAGRPLSSIFIGGGTPSLFGATALKRLLDGVRSRIDCIPDMEITLEANPGTFEQDKFAAYRQLGINRLSIGIQSFNSRHLQQLGRVHNGDEALRAVQIARQAGFERINLDLMHGLPGQSLEQALADLQQAVDLNPGHISWYQLTIEPNTQYWSRPPQLPEDDCLWDIQEQGQALLAQQGYRQYEISAYARPGQQARHNLNYWQFGDFIGIGAGAHGKISHADGRIERYWKTRQPDDYLRSRQPCAGRQLLDSSELPFEFLMNALRLVEGVPAQLFTERTGLPLTALEPARQLAQQRGLLASDPHQLLASAQGQLFLNDLLQIFLDNDN